MSLDLAKLEKVRDRGNKITARCPACAESGNDSTGDHLSIFPEGQYACLLYPAGDGNQHRARIYELAGIKDSRQAIVKTAPAKAGWTPLAYAPASAPFPSLKHFKHGTPSAYYVYKTAEGRIAGIIARLDIPATKDSSAKKQIWPMTWCQDEAGNTEWKLKGMAEPCPLYGLPFTDGDGDDMVIVEGEKCADAIRAAGFPATTWAGGSSASHKTDWLPLKGKIVYIWPDNDEPGTRAKDSLIRALAGIAAEIRVVQIPNGKPVGWDAADTDDEEIHKLVEEAVVVEMPEPTAETFTPPNETCSPTINESQWHEIERRVQLAGGRYQENIFAAEFKKLLPLIFTTGSEWRVFDGSRWELIASPARFLPLALELLAHFDHDNAKRAQDLVAHVSASCQTTQVWRGAYAFDNREAVLLNLANGILRVTRNGMELGPHDWKQGFTLTIPTSWDAQAECPEFMATLSAAMPDPDDRELFRLYAGSILEPSARLEAGLAVFGPSGTGKSTLVESGIAEAIGGPASGTVSRVSLRQLCDPKGYSLPSLEFSMVNIITEGDALEVEESSNFKSIISGEPIECRKIYGKPQVITTTAKLLLATNSLPRFRNGTDAEGRRLRLLNFDQVPTRPDPELKYRIHAESAGILRWMAGALQDVLSLRSMPRGGASAKKVTDRFALSNDSLGCFVKQECSLDPVAWISKEDLIWAFNEFADSHGFSTDNASWFFRKLLERFPHLSSKKRGGIRGVLGVTLKNTSHE